MIQQIPASEVSATEVQIGTLTFDVFLDGRIAEPVRVNSHTLDEVRLLAASKFLGDRVPMTKRQAAYWQAIRCTTDLGNFPASGPRRKR